MNVPAVSHPLATRTITPGPCPQSTTTSDDDEDDDEDNDDIDFHKGGGIPFPCVPIPFIKPCGIKCSGYCDIDFPGCYGNCGGGGGGGGGSGTPPPGYLDPNYPNSSTATQSSSSSSTSSSTAAATPTRYVVTTYEGTSLSAFRAMTNSLPDEGTGTEIVFGNLNWQSYVTKMNSTVAARVEAYTIVEFVVPDVDLDDTDFSMSMDYDAPSHLLKRAGSQTLVRAPNSKHHQKVISPGGFSNYAGTLNDYLYDPIAGAGSTIYVIDTGIQLGHAEFQGVNIINQVYAPANLLSDSPV